MNNSPNRFFCTLPVTVSGSTVSATTRQTRGTL